MKLRRLTSNFPNDIQQLLKKQSQKSYATNPKVKREVDEMKPLLAALREVGLELDYIQDFVNTRESYPEAIPLLIEHLSLPYEWYNKEMIVRALCVKEAKGIANEAIWEEFKKVDKSIERQVFAFANTINTLLLPEEVDKVVEVLKDEEYGPRRRAFIKMLARWRTPEKRAYVLEKAGTIIQKLCDAPNPITQKAARFTWRKLHEGPFPS